MATSHSLKAETRACGSGNLKQLRSQGLVPGVVYGLSLIHISEPTRH